MDINLIDKIREIGVIITPIALIFQIIDYLIKIRVYVFRVFRESFGIVGRSFTFLISLKPYFLSEYLFRREILVILSAGILLNYLGLAVSKSFPQSMFYLDMIGTALTAILLGPWWGAIVGLITSTFTNPLIFSQIGIETSGAEAINIFTSIFPWSIINIFGGLYWGFISRNYRFRNYLNNREAPLISHMIYLTVFGILGAAFMSYPGSIIDRILYAKSQVNTDQIKEFANLIGELNLPNKYFEVFSRYFLDKILTVGIGLLAVRFIFPLFEKKLVFGETELTLPKDNWTSPLLLGILYIPSSMFLYFDYYKHWIWFSPLFFVPFGVILNILKGPSVESLGETRSRRAESYELLLQKIEKQPTYRFYERFTIATLIVTIIAILLSSIMFLFSQSSTIYSSSMIDSDNQYYFVFFLSCFIYILFLGIDLVRISFLQNYLEFMNKKKI